MKAYLTHKMAINEVTIFLCGILNIDSELICWKGASSFVKY